MACHAKQIHHKGTHSNYSQVNNNLEQLKLLPILGGETQCVNKFAQEQQETFTSVHMSIKQKNIEATSLW